jgi:hypothetical protein
MLNRELSKTRSFSSLIHSTLPRVLSRVWFVVTLRSGGHEKATD